MKILRSIRKSGMFSETPQNTRTGFRRTFTGMLTEPVRIFPDFRISGASGIIPVSGVTNIILRLHTGIYLNMQVILSIFLALPVKTPL